MTGDAPQPGETPRDEVDPWSYADPGTSWWRPDDRGSSGPRRRSAAEAAATPTIDPPKPAEHTGAAGVAHQAGTQDALAALTGAPPRNPAVPVEIPDHPPLPAAEPSEPAAAAPEVLPRHAQPDTTDTPGMETAPTGPDGADPVATGPEPTPADPEHATPLAAGPEATTPETAGPEATTPDTTGSEAVTLVAAGSDSAPAVAGKPAKNTPKKTRTTLPMPARAAATRPADLPVTPATESGPAETRGVESDHDRVDAERFNSAGTATSYAARNRTETVAAPEHEPTIIDLLNSIPVEPAAGRPVPEEPAALDETGRNRPTVALDRSPVPGQAPAGSPGGLSRLGKARADRARADRALQDRARHDRTAALLETSTFWQGEERVSAWPPPETREKLANAGQPPRRPVPHPRHPAVGLLGLLALGLVAAFFAWVSAEPFWLAVGHGQPGTATVTRCTGAGVSQNCAGRFTAANGAYRVSDLALFGIEAGQRAPGSVTKARMVSSDSRQAYVGGPGLLMHLRWAVSFLLVLLCGLGIAGLTGARRLDTARARRGALLLSVGGPVLLLVGFLAVTY